MLDLCASLQCDFLTSYWQNNIVAGDAGDGDHWQRDQGEVDHHALLHHQAVLHILLIPSLPLHLLLLLIIILLLLIILLLFLIILLLFLTILLLLLLLLLQEVWKVLRLSLLACRDL